MAERTAADGQPIGDRENNGGARRGFPGKLESARATAPDDATDGDIQDVAFVAWETGRQVEEVWPEVLADG